VTIVPQLEDEEVLTCKYTKLLSKNS